MRTNKVLSWILAVVMLFQCAVITGSAEADSGITRIAENSLRYVNPHYADLVDLDELLVETQSASVWSTESTTVYDDHDQVVEAVRNALIARETSFTISVDVNDEGLVYPDEGAEDYDEAQAALNEFCTGLFIDRPLSHDVNVPNGGDYLQFTLAGYEVLQSYLVSGDNVIQRIDANYSVAYYTTAEQEAAVDAEVARLVDGWNKMGLQTEYQKISAIYNFICGNVTYDHENLDNDEHKTKYTAYGALIDGTSVCQGYANLFYRLALEMGLDARIIAGTGITSTGSGPHAWNIVGIDNTYYNLDSTWDAEWYESGLAYNFYLKGNSFNTDHERDTDYATDEFNADYPMASADYFTYEYATSSGQISGTIVAETPGYTLTAMKNLEGVTEEQLAAAFGDSYPGSENNDWPENGSLLEGEVITGVVNGEHCWENGDSNALMAFDGNTETYFDPVAASTDYWCGVDLGEGKAFTLTEVRIRPRDEWSNRLVGGAVQGSNDGKTWTTVVCVTDGEDAPAGLNYHCFTPYPNSEYIAMYAGLGYEDLDLSRYWMDTEGAYRFYRYVNLNGIHGDIAELELYGVEAESTDDSGDNTTTIGWSLESGNLNIWGEGNISVEDPAKLPWVEYKDTIQRVNIGYGITEIPQKMFAGYPLLHTADIAGSVKTIGSEAFAGCSGLMNLNMNLGIRTLDSNAFSATAVRWVRMPSTVGTYNWAFYAAPFLEGIEVYGDGSVFTTMDGDVLVSFDGKEFCHYPAGRRETSFTIPSGITTLATHCIDQTNLEELILPYSLETVNGYAVTENSRLTTLTIPASVTSIGEQAFASNSSLSKVYFYGDYSAEFAADMFEGAAEDLIVYYPKGNDTWDSCTWETDGPYNFEPFDAQYLGSGEVDGIQWNVSSDGVLTFSGEGAIPDYWDFWDGNPPEWYQFRDAVHTIKIGAGITDVGGNSLREFGNVTEINLPESLKRIGGFAFAECQSLTELNIPADVEWIEDGICWNCQSLESYNVAENNPWYDSVDGVLFTEGCIELIAYPLGRTNETYEIPSTVRSIGATAFENEQDLTSVVLNEGLQFIRDSAFCGVNLTGLVIPMTVRHIENWAFNAGGTLLTVEFEGAFPDYFGEFVFYGNHEDLSANMPDDFSITANMNMPGWDRFTEGVLNAENNPNYPLELIEDPIENFSAGQLENEMTWVIDLDGTLKVTGTGEMPWYDWEGENEVPWKKYARYITAIEISEGIIDVSGGAFADLYNAESLILPGTMKWIHDGAFHNCKSLTNVYIPAGVEHIEGNAFTCNFSMQAFEVDEANEWYESDDNGVLYNESMDWLMFYPVGRTDITEYAVPEHVYEINDNAFKGSSLTRVTFNDGVTVIGHDTFADSLSLTEVVFGSTVAELKNYVFGNCPSLTKATFEGPEPIGDSWDTFTEVPEDFKIYYPANAGWKIDQDGMWWANPDQCYPAVAYTVDNPVIYSETYDSFAWTLTNAGVLTVTGNGELPQFHDGEDGFGGDAPWYKVRGLVREIVVKDGITALGHRSFADMGYVQSMQLPSTLDKLYNCSITNVSLTKLELPAGLTEIENGAFDTMWNLEEITVADGCEAYTVVDGVLYNADKTELVLYPCRMESTAFEMHDTVTMVHASAFKDAQLQSITLSANLEYIGWWAFAHNHSLTEIVIPMTVNYIASCAFYDCQNLKTATFCGPVPTVENEIFEGAAEGFTVHYPSNMSGWVMNDDGKWAPDWNSPYNAEEYVADLPDGFRAEGTVTVDDIYNDEGELIEAVHDICWTLSWDGTLTFSGSGSMPGWDWDENPSPWYQYAAGIKSVVFDENLTTIGRQTFRDCVNLTSVEIPSNIRIIENEAFVGCSALKNVTLNEGLREIRHAAFEGASPEVIELPESLESIHHGAFKFSYVGAFTVAAENEWFFADVDGVLYRYENDEKTYISLAAYPIGRTDEDGQYEAASDISEIYSHAFAGSSLTQITIPDSVTHIGSWVFEWSEQLETVYLPMGISSISDNTFHGCKNLQKLYFRSAPPAEIWHGAFEWVPDSLTVYYPETISAWDEVIVKDEGAEYGIWTFTTLEDDDGNSQTCTFNAVAYDAGISEYFAGDVIKLEECDEEGNVISTREIKWYITWDRVLHITGEGSTPDWDWDNPAPWYDYRDSVDKVVIHDGITRIGGMNFVHLSCTVEIADTVTELASGAFTDCGALGTIRLSKNAAYIYGGAFSGSIVDAFDVDDANPFYFDENGVLIERNSILAEYVEEQPEGSVEVEINGEKAYVFQDIWLLIAYPSGRDAEKYEVPSNVIFIAEMAFSNTQYLSKIILNPELLYINQHAFSGCGKVTEMTIPANVREVGRNFINGWDTLEKVTFEGCAPLFADAIVFEGCSENLEIHYPAGFDSWDKIISYTEEDGYRWNITYTDWDSQVNEKYTVPYRAVPMESAVSGNLTKTLFWELTDAGTLRVCGDGAIRNYNDEFCAPWTPLLNRVSAISVEPDAGGSISIGQFAFRDCGEISSINLEEGVTTINSYAFADCILPAEYVQKIPSTAIIEWAAFACADINSYEVDENENGYITEEEGTLLYYVDDTEKVLLDAGNDVTEVWLPEGVTTIAGTAFDRCSKLTTLMIPAGIRHIGGAVFDACTALSDVYFMGKNEGLVVESDSLFGEANDKVTVRVPQYAKESWSEFLESQDQHGWYGTGYFIHGGDVDADLDVDADDALLLSRYFAGSLGADEGIYLQGADVDGTNGLTRKDAMVLNRWLAGWSDVEINRIVVADE